ncbi:MAG: hypothetical protein IPL53_02795 [Ignavibacteria bacterium]|nr:hypothetical protein [Ignavibacteria bacterium]
MLKSIFMIGQALTLLFAIGCSASQEQTSFTFGVGKYKFTMTDSTGNKVLEGTMNMKAKENNNITGTYEITNVYQKDFPGLSSMTGDFAGNIIPDGKKVFINTNPRIADSNVFWNMTIKKNSVSGEWNFSVFRGSSWKGKIKIVKL